jgi:hypothetical protein
MAEQPQKAASGKPWCLATNVMIGAVGVDAEGRKHVLAIRENATENATVVKELFMRSLIWPRLG